MKLRHPFLAFFFALIPLTGQEPALKETFDAAKSQWAMQGDREGSTARFESVLAALEPKGIALNSGEKRMLCETYHWLAVLEDRVPSKRPQSLKHLDAILDLDPDFEPDRSITNTRLASHFDSTRAARFARVAFALSPADGVLTLDGKPLGDPRKAHFFPPGSCKLRFTRPGYAPNEQVLELAPRTNRNLELNLKRTSSTVRLSTYPVGADLFLDGKPAGSTQGEPGTFMFLEGLTPGRHRIEVKAPCYHTRLLELDESYATPLADHTLEALKLESAKGFLSVSSPVPGGILVLGSQTIGPLPIKNLPICPGPQDFRVDFQEGRFSSRVEVSEGKPISLEVRPRPRLAFLGLEGSIPDQDRLQSLLQALGSRLSQVEFIPSVPGEGSKAARERLKRDNGAELTLLARPSFQSGSPQVELVLATLEEESETILVRPLDQDPMASLVTRLNRPLVLRTPWIGVSVADVPGEPGPWPFQVSAEAERAGLKPFQAISRLNGQPVATVAALRQALGTAKGQEVSLTQQGTEIKMPLTQEAMELPLQGPEIAYPLALAQLRLQALEAKGDAAGSVRLNIALAHLHFRHPTKALEALRDAHIGAPTGVSQGTIDYYRGLCLNNLGGAYASDAAQAWKLAAQSPSATLFGPEGPLVRQVAAQALESMTP